MKLNKKNLNYKRVARLAAREKKGDTLRKLHKVTRIKNVGGKRTAKHQRRVAHRQKMTERELEERGLVVSGELEEEGGDDEAAKAPLPHQAGAIAAAVIASKGGRVKGRARKALRVAGLDPRKGLNGKGKAAAVLVAAIAERDAGTRGKAASGDAMEQ